MRFCQEHRCVPDLIKVDVEGAQERVIAGADACLTSHRATWVIESLPETGSREYLWESFTPLGYAVYRVGRSGLSKVSELSQFVQEPEWESVFCCDRRFNNFVQSHQDSP